MQKYWNFTYENSRASAQYCHLHIRMKISMNSDNLFTFIPTYKFDFVAITISEWRLFLDLNFKN